MSDSSGAKVTNHIASQYKSDHGILACTLITIKLVIFHAKVTYLPCARLPDFWCSFTAVHYGDRRLPAYPSRPSGRRPRSLKSAAQGDGRSQSMRRSRDRGACGAGVGWRVPRIAATDGLEQRLIATAPPVRKVRLAGGG